MDVMVCYNKCWPCNFGSHDECNGTWADEDDIEHAMATGQDWRALAEQPCGCRCMDGA